MITPVMVQADEAADIGAVHAAHVTQRSLELADEQLAQRTVWQLAASKWSPQEASVSASLK